MDPVVLLAAMASHTDRVGLVATMSTSFNEPYNIARQFRSLDVLSKGRIGWNVVTTGRPFALENYFEIAPSSQQRHARSREVYEAVRLLWNSWPQGALKLDKAQGIFADSSLIRPINYHGKYVSTTGPMTLPPSQQGDPIIFTAGGGNEGFDFAVKNADALYGNPYDLQSAKGYWQYLKDGLKQVGRLEQSLKVFSGIITSVASTEREALQRRIELDELGDLPGRVQYLSFMLCVDLDNLDIDAALPADVLKRTFPNPRDRRSSRAVELARQGLTIREILAYGPINYHPVVVGTPEKIANFLQQWFEAGVGGGFNITPDSGLTALTDFVDQVVPILQKRGIFRSEYKHSTLRGHLGLYID